MLARLMLGSQYARWRAQEGMMKTGLLIAAVSLFSGGIAAAQQQAPGQQQTPGQQQEPVVGAQPIGISVQEQALVAKGWSSKNDLLGKAVYNDKHDKIGTVRDVILSPDRTASFAVIGAGGFVGLDRHDVAIPFQQLQLNGSRIELPGATKDTIKSLPEFVYSR